MPPILISAEIYRRTAHGPEHPLGIPRVSAMLDLVRALGWLPAAQFRDSPVAGRAALERFHSPAYLDALLAAEAMQGVSEAVRTRFRIGAEGNPIYPLMFRRPATSAGGTMLAARLTRDGGVAHVPGGGTHHGRADRASGFCYLNDAVLGLMAWLDAGLTRILYLDIDAHHGDGVEEAFRDDPRVVTLSVHEERRWPFTGAASLPGAGNIPVPAGFNDSEMLWVLHEAVLPLVRALRPQAVMLQCGADALEEDPLARLSLSNNAHRAVVRALMDLAPRLIVLGAGATIHGPWRAAGRGSGRCSPGMRSRPGCRRRPNRCCAG